MGRMRYSVSFGRESEAKITKLAAKQDTTKSEVIRKAIASYAYLVDQVNAETGTKISITGRDDCIVKDVILP